MATNECSPTVGQAFQVHSCPEVCGREDFFYVFESSFYAYQGCI